MSANAQEQLEEAMAKDTLYEKYAYVTYEDIKQLRHGGDEGSTLLAI